jgi:hypothetical protein
MKATEITERINLLLGKGGKLISCDKCGKLFQGNNGDMVWKDGARICGKCNKESKGGK